MMTLETLIRKEAEVRRLEAGRIRHFRVAGICTVLAPAFAILDWGLLTTTELVGAAYWTLVVVFSLIPLALAGIAVMAWYFVHRNRKRLAQLKALASAPLEAELPGVWPPPPRATE